MGSMFKFARVLLIVCAMLPLSPPTAYAAQPSNVVAVQPPRIIDDAMYGEYSAIGTEIEIC